MKWEHTPLLKKVGFVGFRSSQLADMRLVFENALGLLPTDIADDQVGYLLEDGTRLECYSESNVFHSFFVTGPVIGFFVSDFDASCKKLNELGIEFISEIQEDSIQSWVHFRFGDGVVCELMGPRRV
jgi:hypothetical protein